ncbi:hypothetical protein BJ986_000256 [Phycicoccus badiiscoriae]|uniref:Uncharacterized protein n=1 Tax=Pedococcus badiiscoriae TaxID=642776 RepID=A0A852WAB7_9MICO|nr:hypothetical protein [Pedococcus badiiscoriae]NYG05769.1 hypothetical protein [Pedococcus badiiscoriae]
MSAAGPDEADRGDALGRAGGAGGGTDAGAGDDRILTSTRGLSAFIAPFLLVAFVLLYGYPGDTARLWSWPIQAHMTSMLLASAYLGGCYFFLRVVLLEQHWAAVRAGFVSVALFATLLGIATILHWDKFTHTKVAFWLWAGLYFTAPFLVLAALLTNQRYAGQPAPDAPRLGQVPRLVVAGVGGLAVLTGLFLFLVPAQAITVWPWPLTPLTARVVGATFCLGAAALAVLLDDRWEAVRLMRTVQLVMFGLILVAAVRARHEFFTGRPLTWVMGVGFVGLFAASITSALRDPDRQRSRGRHEGPRAAPTGPAPTG